MTINPQYITHSKVIQRVLQEKKAIQLRDFFTHSPRWKNVKIKFLPDQNKFKEVTIEIKEVVEYLKLILPNHFRLHETAGMKFEEGDYTLLHDSVRVLNTITILYDVLTTNGAKAVFQNKTEKFEISGHKNTLTVIQGKYHHYFKYVNHKQQQRIVLCLQGIS